MDDEPQSEEFSFPKITQDGEGVDSMNLSRSIWLPYCSTTTTTRATAAAVSECCSFPTCPHNTEVANHLISATTKEEEHRVEEGRTPRSSAPTTPKASVKLPRSPTTTSPRSVSPMDSMWEDQNDGSDGVAPSRRRRSLLSGSATPKSFSAEDLAEERMDMLWEEYHEHDEFVEMGIMCQFLKKHWLGDDDDDDMDDEDDDGESSPYTGSQSSSSSTVNSATPTATNNAGSTPEMMARLCCAQVLQMSKGGSPAAAVVPIRKPGLRVILKVLKKLFLLHHSHHHRSARSKRSSSKVRSSSPTIKY